MNDLEPWGKNDYDDNFGLENYDIYGDNARAKKKKRWGAILAVLVLLTVCSIVLTIRSAIPAEPRNNSNITKIVVVHTVTPGPPPEGVDVGLTAPNFTLKTVDGGSITLSSLRGKVVLLNFWATWCPPCREEMPAFQSIFEKFKNDGFIIISITEEIGDDLDKVISFRESNNLSFPILLDEAGAVNRRYYVTTLPRSLLITPEGIIHKILLGSITEDRLTQEISSMLP